MTNVKRSNFLRFGRSSSKEMMGPNGLSKDADKNMHRRDYREFVRFGKRSSLPRQFPKRRDDFLRFGRMLNLAAAATAAQRHAAAAAQREEDSQELHKKSNDFLRFG